MISCFYSFYLPSLESTQEARVAFGYRLEQLLRFLRALQTSRVHPELDVRTLSMNHFFNFRTKKKKRAQIRGNREVLISGAKKETFRTSYVENITLLWRHE